MGRPLSTNRQRASDVWPSQGADHMRESIFWTALAFEGELGETSTEKDSSKAWRRFGEWRRSCKMVPSLTR